LPINDPKYNDGEKASRRKQTRNNSCIYTTLKGEEKAVYDCEATSGIDNGSAKSD